MLHFVIHEIFFSLNQQKQIFLSQLMKTCELNAKENKAIYLRYDTTEPVRSYI